MKPRSDLIDEIGNPRFGVYEGEIDDITLPLSNRLMRLRSKRWHFVGIYSSDVVAGVAIVDAGYMKTAFAYAADLHSKRLTKFQAKAPMFGPCINIYGGAMESEAVFRRGGNHICIRSGRAGSNICHVDVDVATKDGRLIIDTDIDISTKKTLPHQVISPTPSGSFFFTHKCASLPTEGMIATPCCTFSLAKKSASSAVDITAGLHDYHWQWRWASMAGFADNGVRIGLNLAEPVYNNQWHENAMWIDGKRIQTSVPNFNFDAKDLMKPWQVRTENGEVELEFVPQANFSERVNLMLIKDDFAQLAGVFSGYISNTDGNRINIDRLPGVVETHVAKW